MYISRENHATSVDFGYQGQMMGDIHTAHDLNLISVKFDPTGNTRHIFKKRMDEHAQKTREVKFKMPCR